jgi:hypothetical protein
MSNEPKDGGLAFPTYVHPTSNDGREMSGMSLRDWFAGQALNGICAGLCASPEDSGDTRGGANHRISFSHAAKDAYTLADAMLAARSLSA